MSNNTLYYLLGLALVAMAALLAIRLSPSSGTFQPQKYIERGDVRGSAVVKQGYPYTLNFDQQTAMLEDFNQAIPVGEKPFKINPNMPYSKIVIYRFNANPIEITPIDFDGKDLIFSAPEWNKEGYMRDISEGALNRLLNKAYDS